MNSHPFYFLMPVWGERYIGYLLDLGLATLLSPGNIPNLPNLKESEFVFLTTEADAERIRETKLYSELAEIISIKWKYLEFYQGNRQEKFDQLTYALKEGLEEVTGRGYCLFLHPDGIYSEGMMTRLYQLALEGKKAVISIGPNVTEESVIPYLEERQLLRKDSVVSIPPRTMAKILIDNLHPDMTNHLWENKYYPEVPYLAIWGFEETGAYLFHYISLHPYLVDLRNIKKLREFGAIDHDFVRAQNFLFREVHIECDSDDFIVLSIKPFDECNSIPSTKVNTNKKSRLRKSLLQDSNCSYSRYNFLNGAWVHTNELSSAEIDFEKENLDWINQLMGISIRRSINHIISVFINLTSYQKKLVIVRKLNQLIISVVPKSIRHSLRVFFTKKIENLPEKQRESIKVFLSDINKTDGTR